MESFYNLFIFLKKELIQIGRDKKILLLLIIAPMLQLIILGYAATFDVKKIPTIICDLDKSNFSKELTDAFINSGYFILIKKCKNIKEINTYLDGNIARTVIIIPYNFEKKLKRKEDISVPIIIDGTDGITSNVVIAYSFQIINNFAAKIRDQILNISIPSIRANLRIWYNQELKSSYYMVPAIFALLLSIVTIVVSSMSLVKEKELGTIEQLLVSPLKFYQIIIGKIFPFIIIAFIDVILVLLISYKWFKVPIRGSLLDFAIAVCLFLLSSLGLALIVSIKVSTQQQAMMVSLFFIFLPSILLSGFVFPIENMPTWVQPISYALPVTYFIKIIRAIFLKGDTFENLINDYIALAIIGLIILFFIRFSYLRTKRIFISQGKKQRILRQPLH